MSIAALLVSSVMPHLFSNQDGVVPRLRDKNRSCSDFLGSLPEGTLLEDVQNEPGVPGEIVLHGWHVNMSEVSVMPELLFVVGESVIQWMRFSP